MSDLLNYLTTATVNLLQSCPESPEARALILKQTQKRIPPELKTWAEVEKWLVRQLKPKRPLSLRVPGECTRLVRGMRWFVAQEKGTGEVRFTQDDLASWASEAASMDQLTDYVLRRIEIRLGDSLAMKKVEGTEAIGEIRTERYAVISTQTTFDKQAAKKRIQEILQKRFPAEYARLKGATGQAEPELEMDETDDEEHP